MTDGELQFVALVAVVAILGVMAWALT